MRSPRSQAAGKRCLQAEKRRKSKTACPHASMRPRQTNSPVLPRRAVRAPALRTLRPSVEIPEARGAAGHRFRNRRPRRMQRRGSDASVRFSWPEPEHGRYAGRYGWDIGKGAPWAMEAVAGAWRRADGACVAGRLRRVHRATRLGALSAGSVLAVSSSVGFGRDEALRAGKSGRGQSPRAR